MQKKLKRPFWIIFLTITPVIINNPQRIFFVTEKFAFLCFGLLNFHRLVKGIDQMY